MSRGAARALRALVAGALLCLTLASSWALTAAVTRAPEVAVGELTIASFSSPPVAVGGIETSVGLPAEDFACALPGDGTVVCWGDNTFGQLGYGQFTDPRAPAGDVFVFRVVAADATGAQDQSCVDLDADGSVVECRGADSIENAVAITAGVTHACALLADTTVMCWGSNEPIPGVEGAPGQEFPGAVIHPGGQLGDGTTVARSAPVVVIAGPGDTRPLSGVRALSAADGYTCAVMVDDTAKCWGDAPWQESLAPVTVSAEDGTPLGNIASLTAGDWDACAVLHDGHVACWVGGRPGGDGPFGDPSAPWHRVVEEDPAVDLSGIRGLALAHNVSIGPNGFGFGHGCALGVDGMVDCWGVNDVSQLGNGFNMETGPDETFFDHAAPVISGPGSFQALSRVEQIAAGGYFTCALLDDGQVKCWGLGLGGSSFVGGGAPISLGASEAPVARSDSGGLAAPGERSLLTAAPATGVVAIAAGGSMVCGVTSDSRLWCADGAQELVPVPGLRIAAPAGPAPTPTPLPTSTPPGPTRSASPTVGGTPPPSAGGGAPTDHSGTFRTSLPLPWELSRDPLVLAFTVVFAVVVVLLFPFPGALFNSTLRENYDEIMGGLRRSRRRVRNAVLSPWFAVRSLLRLPIGPRPVDIAVAEAPGSDHRTNEPSRDPWSKPIAVGGFLVVTAVLIGLLDPAFGPDPASLTTFVGMLIGLAAVLVAFELPWIRYYRQQKMGFSFRALPATIVVAVFCVLLSRLTDFQPGYLYGLIITTAVAEKITAPRDGQLAGLGAALALGLGLLAWGTLGVLATVFDSGDASPLLAVTQTVLTLTTTAGIETAAFGLLPFTFLSGAMVRGWSKPVWVALVIVAWGSLLYIILDPRNGFLADSTRTPLLTIVGLLVFFAVGSVVFWWYFRRRRIARERRDPGRPELGTT